MIGCKKDWINYFNNLSLFVMFTNQLNQSTINTILSTELLHTKSIHTPYTISGILEEPENKKPENFQLSGVFSGSYRSQTYDLLLVNQSLCQFYK